MMALTDDAHMKPFLKVFHNSHQHALTMFLVVLTVLGRPAEFLDIVDPPLPLNFRPVSKSFPDREHFHLVINRSEREMPSDSAFSKNASIENLIIHPT